MILYLYKITILGGRNMKKKVISLTLVLCMLLSFMPIIASAATSGTCGDNLTWTLDDNGTLTISGTGNMSNYYSSSTAGSRAPWITSTSIKNNLETVVISDGVTSIGDNAFGACGQLEEVVLPTSLTNLGAAFSYCPIKTMVYLTDSVPCAGASNTLKTVETVCVLESMVSKFKETEYWRDRKIKPYDGIPLNTALDLNGDWKINSADVVMTYNWISDSIVLEDGEKNPADLNQDGTVNSADVVGLYNYI